MPVRIANHSVTVVRDGKRYEVEAGQGIDLTKEEIAQFKELNPDAFRTPKTNVINVVNGGVLNEGEGVSEEEPENTDATDADTSGTTKGRKAATTKGKAGAKDADADAGEGDL